MSIKLKQPTMHLATLGQKKLIISFSGQFFQKLMRQGGFIFYFLLLQIRMMVFIFFLPRCDATFFITISLFSICLWMSICLYIYIYIYIYIICQSN